MLTRGRSVLAARGRNDVAAELVRHQLQPVADPEDRDPARPEAGIGLRSALVVHAGRTARQDDGNRLPAANLVERGVERQELRVDVELTHAAGDQLRVLAPEIEDDDGVRLRNRAPLDGHLRMRCVERAAGGGRVERGLEVGLDFGIVRGKDAVSGVRGLTMNGLATLSWSGPLMVFGPRDVPRFRHLWLDPGSLLRGRVSVAGGPAGQNVIGRGPAGAA